jgi:hypothetical protein
MREKKGTKLPEENIEDGLARALRKLSEQTGTLKNKDKEALEVDKAITGLAKATEVEQKYIRESFAGDDKSLKDTFKRHESEKSKAGTFAGVGLLSGYFTAAAGSISIMGAVQYLV